MVLEIQHNFLYTYDKEVVLEPHILYAHPKKSSLLRVISFELSADPSPTTVVKNLDFSDNVQHILYFKKPTSSLSIYVKSVVEISEFNPFSFLYLPDSTQMLPMQYSNDENQMLQPYLSLNEMTTLIDQTARSIAAQANWNTSDFLIQLNQYIHSFQYQARLEGNAYSPEKTLIEKKGSCRDYSVLFMTMAKAMKIASRFVSGYYYAQDSESQTLHAWVEVYLPGGGWRGYDPTQNCLVSGNHIPLGSSAIPTLVAPLTGAYRGVSNAYFEAPLSIRLYDSTCNNLDK